MPGKLIVSHHAITRRQFVAGSLAASVLGTRRGETIAQDSQDREPFRLFWGDLHNHNAVGYGQGSLERSIDIARQHLDFFAFTGHASWHDMPQMEGDRHLKWVNGFKAHADHWPMTRQLIREANGDDFVALLGYEWHSSAFGDYCTIFPSDQPDLFLPDHVDKLLDFAEAKGALAIPHHVAYQRGWRGANFDHFRPAVSPVVEIFSEHGCAESVAAPYPYIRHSNGGRSTANTVQRHLHNGLRFGFVASSDNHRGYPGAYGEGLTGIWARELTAEALFEALRARRTYAVTGDRIILDVTLNGHPMGSQIPFDADRQIDVRVEGQDSIASIELVRNGQVIDRHFPEDHATGRVQLPGRAKCRVQYGWGPWAALALGRICQWDVTLRIERGLFHDVIPCWQSGPYHEDLRDRLQFVSPNEIRLRSFTSRENCFAEDPTKSVVIDLEGGPDATLSVSLRQPVEQAVRARLGQLADDNLITGTGGFFSESYIIHRLVPPDLHSATVRFHDRRPAPTAPDYYYLRVRQHNHHLAWSSPIWVG